MNKIAYVDYYKVGKIDEIMKSGWKTVSLLGWDIVVIFHNREFFAIERGGLSSRTQKAFLPDDESYSRSGAENLVGKFLVGPDGALWGKLKYFPVRLEGDFVMVGITH
jgi:hypothetical protein